MNTYQAIYRYREADILKTTSVTLEAQNKKDAIRTAKNMEGQDNKTWLIEVRP
jgi:hypothetical protein